MIIISKAICDDSFNSFTCLCLPTGWCFYILTVLNAYEYQESCAIKIFLDIISY